MKRPPLIQTREKRDSVGLIFVVLPEWLARRFRRLCPLLLKLNRRVSPEKNGRQSICV